MTVKPILRPAAESRRVNRHPTGAGFLLAAAFAGVLLAGVPASGVSASLTVSDSARVVVSPCFESRLDSLLAAHPYADSTRFQSDRISAVGGASLHLVQTRVPVPPHFHARHDETVVVLRGRGVFYAGSPDAKDRQATAFAPGTVFQIPRGTVHAVRVTGVEPVVAYSIFSPPFDATDRNPVPGWLEKPSR